MSKDHKAYKTIGEVVRFFQTRSKKSKSIPAHTIRFWEKEFKQLKPKILNGNRRYYDHKNINLLEKIHFLLKEQGMTINGVKKILNNNEPLKLDESMINHVRTDVLKKKINNISKIVKSLKTDK